ncbi:hypothetical protein TorRG33x02_016060 [Trema orientale]|uniref:Uncharacterized protein n=1 Tax=Trema orientale TaxID=63057 RepID=A0A2P5FXW2_TREOI|nr:hypothetical protein TorRG33x02_016060 [Trema orientale]
MHSWELEILSDLGLESIRFCFSLQLHNLVQVGFLPLGVIFLLFRFFSFINYILNILS